MYCHKLKLLPGQHQLCVVTVYTISGAGPFSVNSMDNVRRSTFRCYRMGMFKERVLTIMCLSKRRTKRGWRRVHNEDFSVLHGSLYVGWTTQLSRMFGRIYSAHVGGMTKV